ncbi:hypothetical protein F2Q68_00026002 [Brassica cretica]|uniref:Uncharacterized protein n=1 Tax=Brassica cretica TaxID=69181 RepID=A0A8S9IC18_BRACR|nr:hypothetical protein F2Q68_00026002 [Brassica cretica]
MEEVKDFLDEARSAFQGVKKMTKVGDPGKFEVPCTISGIEFHDAPRDTWTVVSAMPKDITEKLGLATKVSKTKLAFPDLSSRSSPGVVNNLDVKIENYIVSVDFHVL